MIALLTLAWWKQKLTGIVSQAAALAVIVAVIVAIGTGALWWLRHDARLDERASARTQSALAVAAATRDAMEKMRRSEVVAAKAAESWAWQLSASEAARAKAEADLEAMQERRVCYPRAVVKDLNR